MVEPILYASFGFLVATLLWLLFLPAFWRRAVRLTRRRLIDRLPVSAADIVASQDRLRAEHAVAMRAVERRAEQAVAAIAQERLEAGRARATELGHLAEIGELKARIAALEGEAARLTAALERADAESRAAAAALDLARSAHDSATTDRDAALQASDAARRATEQARIEATAREAEVITLRAQIATIKERVARPVATGPAAPADAAVQAESLSELRRRLDEVADAVSRVESAPGEDSASRPRTGADRVRLVSSQPERAGA
ncbi:MAG TPA: hypothetical protein VGC51_01395 [Hansschlegelia sp.]